MRFPILPLSFAAFAALLVPGAARAVPVNAQFTDDLRGDAVPSQMLYHELGDATRFPLGSGLVYHDHRLPVAQVQNDDGIANDWTVHITNTTGVAWTDMFFVADLGATIGNADGAMRDLLGASRIVTDAFRIDATGANVNLFFESQAADGILAPGEEWEFAVSNFVTGPGNSVPPVIITPGVFAGSSPLDGTGGLVGGNASIIGMPATVVPEPTAIGALTAFAVTLLARRTSRAAVASER